MLDYKDLLDWLNKEYRLTENREVFYNSQHNVRCGELKALQSVIDHVKTLNPESIEYLGQEDKL